jgi:hypothetical protein
MESNEILRKRIFEIKENQLKDNNPPEAKSTYERLISQGFDDLQTRKMIGQCLSEEICEVLFPDQHHHTKKRKNRSENYQNGIFNF